MIDCLIDYLINKLIDELFDWLFDQSIDWWIVWLIFSLIDCWICLLIDWLICWLIDWLIGWLVNWLVDWLIDWLIDEGATKVKMGSVDGQTPGQDSLQSKVSKILILLGLEIYSKKKTISIVPRPHLIFVPYTTLITVMYTPDPIYCSSCTVHTLYLDSAKLYLHNCTSLILWPSTTL